jgi:beta-glucosidase
MDKKGTSYDAKKMQILRQDYGFDGVVCTDWGVTSMKGDPGNRLPLGMAWGMENENAATRHYEILKLGTDIFGGNNDKKPVLDAYKMWEEAYKKGEVNIPADARFRQSGERILKMFFAPGLFENPYLNLDESKKQVASADKVKAGFDAQVQSLVLVKNKGNVIAKKDINQDFKDKTVYIPSTYWHKFKTVFETAKDEHGHTMDIEIAKKYFKEVLTDEPVLNDKGKVTSFKMPDLSNVDLVIIGVKSPDNGSNFSSAGQNEETGEFYPLSLQYREYIASGDKVRKQSISGDTGQNRTYFNQKSNIGNPYDLQAVLNAKEALTTLKKKVPVLVALKAKNPTIISEFEKEVDAIVVGFGVGDEAYYDVLLGNTEPSGLLPAQFPADMNTVEANLEDKAFDLTPYKDSVGNVYDFAFGLNYKGIIKDDRVKNFK